MFKIIPFIFCVSVLGFVSSGCQKTDEVTPESAPTTTRAQADGLTQVPGQQVGAQPPMSTSNTGTTLPSQSSTYAADSKDDH